MATGSCVWKQASCVTFVPNNCFIVRKNCMYYVDVNLFTLFQVNNPESNRCIKLYTNAYCMYSITIIYSNNIANVLEIIAFTS